MAAMIEKSLSARDDVAFVRREAEDRAVGATRKHERHRRKGSHQYLLQMHARLRFNR
jgi:hypothetical protein